MYEVLHANPPPLAAVVSMEMKAKYCDCHWFMPLQARLEDSGKYLCWVNNTAGEETIQVSLTVTGKWVDREWLETPPARRPLKQTHTLSLSLSRSTLQLRWQRICSRRCRPLMWTRMHNSNALSLAIRCTMSTGCTMASPYCATIALRWVNQHSLCPLHIRILTCLPSPTPFADSHRSSAFDYQKGAKGWSGHVSMFCIQWMGANSIDSRTTIGW